MNTFIAIAVILVALAFWKHVLRGLFGAFIFGLIGSVFGDTGVAVGAILGFLGGISAQNSSSAENERERNTASEETKPNTATEPEHQSKAETAPSSEDRIIRCPSCKQKIRVKLPLRINRGRCGRCSTSFGLKVDAAGQLRVEEIETVSPKSPKTDSTPSVADLYRSLGIEASASPDEVRVAYIKRIREYHPDRVAGLGDKLQAMANEESKAINTAYSKLKAAGLAS